VLLERDTSFVTNERINNRNKLNFSIFKNAPWRNRSVVLTLTVTITLILYVALSVIAYKTILKAVASVKTDVASVKTEVASVKTEVASVKTDVASVKTEVASVKTDVASVKTEVASVKTGVASVKTGVDSVKTGVDSVKTGVDSVKTGVDSVTTEVASVKTGVASVSGFIPPLYGARHIEVRRFSILAQAEQLQNDFVLVTGDSITEGLYLQRLLDLPVLNGGMGGGGVRDVQGLLDNFPTSSRIKAIVIAAGVNDSVRMNPPSGYFENWEKIYRSVVAKAKQLTEGHVAVSTIIPVEADKPLGDQYFDPDTIFHLNSIIRKVSVDQKVVLIDNDPPFMRLLTEKNQYTVDGVHMNRTGFETWKRNLQAAIGEQSPSLFLK
jgi:lysophospholipase L1-like esterase/archaellum component FlaC